MALSDGLYDLLLTEGLARSLAALDDPGSAEVVSLKGGAPEVLVDVITRQLGAILDDVVGDDIDKPKRQLELVNELPVMLRHRLAAGDNSDASSGSAEVIDLVAQPLRVLRAVQREGQFQASPEIGLAAPWLFTAGKGSPSLAGDPSRVGISRSVRHSGQLHHRIGGPQAAGPFTGEPTGTIRRRTEVVNGT